jgi:hypothetical protein
MSKLRIKPLGKSTGITIGSEEKFAYAPDSQISIKQLDSKKLNSLTEDIKLLDKKSHIMIYTLIRKYKGAKFFTRDGDHIIFNRDKLPKKILLDLYNLVELCKKSISEKKRFEMRQTQHDDKINNLKLNMLQTYKLDH